MTNFFLTLYLPEELHVQVFCFFFLSLKTEFFKKKFIEVWLVYSVPSISAVQHSDQSYIYKHSFFRSYCLPSCSNPKNGTEL